MDRGVNVLVVNVGSSSVKLRVVGGADELLAAADLRAHPDDADIEAFVLASPPIGAIAHRVVHGGPGHHGAVLLTDAVLADLDDVSTLAPLHNPPALDMARVVRRLHPDLPTVACFDTAFHATIPVWSRTYAIPARWTELGLRRYGFHGLNHAYASRRAAALLGRPLDDLLLVTCHLGAGASLAAVAGGRSVDTTMGFTPLEGLVMATRSGSVDPGGLLWLQREHGVSPDELDDALNHQSGVLGLSQRSADLREVLAAAGAGDDASELALAVYVHRLRAGIAAMATAMGGVDGVVFTGGVGENSAAVRRSACDGLGFIGVGIDRSANESADDEEADVVLTARGAATQVVRVRAREELEMARQVRDLLGA